MENGSLVQFIDSVFDQFFRASLTEDIAVQEHLLFYLRALTTTMAMVRMVTSVHQRCFAAFRKKTIAPFFFILHDVAELGTKKVLKNKHHYKHFVKLNFQET